MEAKICQRIDNDICLPLYSTCYACTVCYGMYSISYTAVSWRLDSKNTCTSNTSLCRSKTIFLVITLYSIQSAKLFLQSSELGHPHPHTSRRVCSPIGSGRGAHSLAGEGVGESQFKHSRTLYIYVTLWL
jgi:hypothetical protein